MTMRVRDAIGGPGAAAIASLERYCGNRLPEDFRAFLAHGNGGRPVRQHLPVAGADRVIERFLPLMDDPGMDPLHGQYDISVVETQIGERLADDPDRPGCRLIPFAVLFGGDFLCFDYRRDPAHPCVVIWDHERSEEFSPCTREVARSFSDLIAGLM